MARLKNAVAGEGIPAEKEVETITRKTMSAWAKLKLKLKYFTPIPVKPAGVSGPPLCYA
jgi:hypothetical protein